MMRVDLAAAALFLGALALLYMLAGVMFPVFVLEPHADRDGQILFAVMVGLYGPVALISMIIATRLIRRRFDGWLGGIFLFAVLGWLSPAGPVFSVFGLWALLTAPGREAFGIRVAPAEVPPGRASA